MPDIKELTEHAEAAGISVFYFDAFYCEVCGKDSGDWEGGVEPNPYHAYCSECWPKHKHLYEEE